MRLVLGMSLACRYAGSKPSIMTMRILRLVLISPGPSRLVVGSCFSAPGLQDDGLEVAQLLHGVLDPLAPDAALLHAAERDVGHVELRALVDGDAAHLEVVDAVADVLEVAGHDAGLQAVLGGIGDVDR